MILINHSKVNQVFGPLSSLTTNCCFQPLIDFAQKTTNQIINCEHWPLDGPL